jgi:radical SAM superfamily enzyme YgiQ (UPF0313 family)
MARTKTNGINPARYLWRVILAPPVTFETLAAVTPPEHTIRLIDERTEKVNFNTDYDLVGISTTTPASRRAYELADEFRRRGITVVLGGWHPSLFPQEAKQHADTVVSGEGDEVWPQLLQDMKHGQLKPFYMSENMVDFPALPVPKRTMQHRRGFFINELQVTRGCCNGCKYCSTTYRPYGQICRLRPIDKVIEEIESMRQKYLYFTDSSLTLNPAYTIQLFTALKNLNKKFACNGNVNVLFRDKELIKLSLDAGCVEWAIGFESISQESLNLLGKQTNKIDEFAPTVKKLHDFGLGVKGNFIFGADGDHPDIFNKTIDAISDWELDIPAFSFLTPFPGTPLYQSLEAEKRIFSKDWSLYDLNHVVFQPKHMSPQELSDGMQKVRDTMYSFSNNLKRAVRCFGSKHASFVATGIQNFFI